MQEAVVKTPLPCADQKGRTASPMKNLIYSAKARAIAYQVIALVAVVLAGLFLTHTAATNIAEQKIATGFGFLEKEAGFEIFQPLIDYDASATYLRALTAGLLNTLLVAVLGIGLSILLGTVIGIARLSDNWLLRQCAGVYVESLRNIPVLLQLLFWYAIFTEAFPVARNAINPIEGVYFSRKGIQIPALTEHPMLFWLTAGLVVIVVLAFIANHINLKRQQQTGKQISITPYVLASLVVYPLIIWLSFGMPVPLELPQASRFGFRGGLTISPEFCAVLIGLTLYTAAFVAEIVRTGILSVDKGQTEASKALGLSSSKTMRLVVLPQALRVIIPPLTSQMLNLTKNSSLAVAVGYPDIVNVAQTTMNQTGQAIEAICILMAVYLTISLLTSFFMNLYNKRVSRVYQR